MKHFLLLCSALILLNAKAQTPNTQLDPDFVYDPTAAGTFIYDFQEYGLNRVHALSDGKVMVVGSFREIFNNYSGVMRLNNDGSIDQSFMPPNTDDNIFIKGRSFYELQNGQYLVGGIFQPNPFSGFVTGLMRLNNDGSQDTDFGAGLTYPSVQAIAVQPDGKILIGGIGSSLDWGASVARLNPDGTIDESFSTGSLEFRDVRELILLPDGSILAAGNFTSWPTPDGPYATVGVALLNADGSLNPSFSHAAETSFSTVVSAYPRAAVQPDGKIVVASLSPQDDDIVQVVRYNTDFSLDGSFYEANTPEVSGSSFTGVTILSDGKILLSGEVINYDGNNSVSGVFRLNPDGTIDETFDTNYGFGNSAPVLDCDVQSDGKILLFTIDSEYQGVDLGPNDIYPVRQTVVRLNGDVTPVLSVAEAERLKFDMFPNPASDQVTLSGVPFRAEVRIFDIQGRLVYQNFNQGEVQFLNTGALAPGIYIVSITDGTRKSSRKLIIEP
jgi:uncharacterized delta-60 repeat protein